MKFKSSRKKKISIHLFLLTILPAIAIVSCVLSDADARDETDKSPGKQTGSIHGTVLCDEGNGPSGRVCLFGEYNYIGDAEIDMDGNFSFTDLEPGSYNLSNYEFGWIPGETDIPVEVVAGETAEITLHSLLCLSCSEILDMSFDEFSRLTESTYSSYIYCEAGMDAVAQIYGTCYEDRNNEMIESLDETDRGTVTRLRDMIYYFEEPFLVLEWTGGTGAGHMLNRAIVDREMLIREIAEGIGEPENNRDAVLEEWNTTVGGLYMVAEYFDSMVESEYPGEVMTGVPEQLRIATSGLDGVVQTLPAQGIELVNSYMQVYLYPLQQDE